MSYLRQLQREHKAKESEIQRTKEKIEFMKNYLPKLEAELEELSELIGVVSKLPRYSDKK